MSAIPDRTTPILTNAVADTNSPISVASADAGGAHPLTVIGTATGMIISVRGGNAGQGAEIALSSTKGTGTYIGRGTSEYFRFSDLAAPEAYFINADGTMDVSVVYTVN